MKALIVTCIAVATLALAGVAAAAGGSGASVTDSYSCVTNPFLTSCADVHLVTNATSTPSGGTTYLVNGTSTFTQTTRFGCSYERSEPLHLAIVQRDGETQVDHERLIQTISFDCGGTWGQTCTQTIELHFANGEARVGRYDFVCENL
jgi:hypothetical protein